MEIGRYSTVEDGDRRVQYCGGYGVGGGVEVDTKKDWVGGGELWRMDRSGGLWKFGDFGYAVGGRCWGTVHVEVEVDGRKTVEDEVEVGEEE
jgi:hypothetical protein